MVVRISEGKIYQLYDNEVFVFGSNEAGIHGAGAAKQAYFMFGAEYGKGEGLHGQSYAIPTKDHSIGPLSMHRICDYVHRFLDFAEQNPQYDFLVTEIGCGLAGHRVEDIAPMFERALKLENVFLPRRFTKVLTQLV